MLDERESSTVLNTNQSGSYTFLFFGSKEVENSKYFFMLKYGVSSEIRGVSPSY